MNCTSLFTMVIQQVLECCGRRLFVWNFLRELLVAVFRRSAAIVVDFVLCSSGRRPVIDCSSGRPAAGLMDDD